MYGNVTAAAVAALAFLRRHLGGALHCAPRYVYFGIYDCRTSPRPIHFRRWAFLVHRFAPGSTFNEKGSNTGSVGARAPKLAGVIGHFAPRLILIHFIVCPPEQPTISPNQSYLRVSSS